MVNDDKALKLIIFRHVFHKTIYKEQVLLKDLAEKIQNRKKQINFIKIMFCHI